MNDSQLLAAYANDRSEAAFESLVKRHVDLVHSVALRQVLDPALAQDVTQAVFLLLARKSGSLGPNVVLTGWLFRTTRFMSTRALRTESRREHREQEAAAMTPTILDPHAHDPAWKQIEPLLDAAVASLSEADRQAVLLRFYGKQTLSKVGAQLGMSEEAAKKRVSRAVEKLRAFFTRRNITLSSAVLLAAIADRSVSAAPSALPGQIAAAMSSGATRRDSGLISLLVLAGLRQLMWRNVGIGLGIGAALVTCMLLLKVVAPSRENDQATSSTPSQTTEVVAAARPVQAIFPRVSTISVSEPIERHTFRLTVLATESGLPLEEADVLVDWWRKDQLEQLPQLRTDASGRVEFQIPQKPWNSLYVSVARNGRAPKLVRWLDYELTEELTSYTLRLAAAGALNGFVIDTHERPVPGAKVFFSGGPGADLSERESPEFSRDLSSTMTGEDGSWSMKQLPLDWNSISITASHPSFARTQVGIPSPYATNIAIILTNGFPVMGRVRTSNGDPIVGCRVCKNTDPLWCVRTDTEGNFEIGLVGTGMISVQVHADGYYQIETRVRITNGPNHLTFEMEAIPAAARSEPKVVRIFGTVVDEETGSPIPSFKLVQGDQWNNNRLMDAAFVGEGRNGRFDWTLPVRSSSTRSVGFQVEAEGYQRTVSSPRNLLEGEQFLEFKLKHEHSMRGRVLTPAGHAAANANVTLSGNGFGATMQRPGVLMAPNREFKSMHVTTDSDGYFSVTETVGTHSLVAVHESGYAYVPLVVATNQPVVLEPWSAVDGLILLGGKPAAEQFIEIQGRSQFLSFSYRTKTDANGRFRFNQVPTGEHAVSQLANYAEGRSGYVQYNIRGTVVVQAGETANIELIRPGRAVVGRVQLPDSNEEISWGYSKAVLRIDSMGSTDAQAEFPFGFRSDGSIQVDAVPPGKYVLQIDIAAATDQPGVGGGTKLGYATQTVIIPEVPTGNDAPFDLGVVKLR